MNELTYTLLQLWVLWYASAAFVGSFLGVAVFFGIRALYHNVTKRR